MDTIRTQVDEPKDKIPRTERGRRTLRKLLDSAALEFGEKGFHDSSIVSITSRAGLALGTFYTYFDSKNEIFRALVNDMSSRVRTVAGDAITPDLNGIEVERAAFIAFLKFARENKEIYRIIDEAEFTDPMSYRRHYESTAQRIHARLSSGGDAGLFQAGLGEPHAWAIMGMYVFLGLRYCVWSDDRSYEEIADVANSILGEGILNKLT